MARWEGGLAGVAALVTGIVGSSGMWVAGV
jgi:hypothetical protein